MINIKIFFRHTQLKVSFFLLKKNWGNYRMGKNCHVVHSSSNIFMFSLYIQHSGAPKWENQVNDAYLLNAGFPKVSLKRSVNQTKLSALTAEVGTSI